MANKPTIEEIRKALKNTNWELYGTRVIWRLNPPRCICCEDLYRSWLDSGKKLYVGQEDVYEKIVAEENLHRKNVQISRDLRERELEALAT